MIWASEFGRDVGDQRTGKARVCDAWVCWWNTHGIGMIRGSGVVVILPYTRLTDTRCVVLVEQTLYDHYWYGDLDIMVSTV